MLYDSVLFWVAKVVMIYDLAYDLTFFIESLPVIWVIIRLYLVLKKIQQGYRTSGYLIEVLLTYF
jgi:hypothetical protein